VTDAGNESLALFGVSGGGTERGTIGDSNVYVYDMGSKSWRTVESDATLQPIFQAAPAFDEAKRQMYLIGGMVAGTMDRRPQAVWRADLETGTWKALHPGGVAPPGNEYGFDSSIGIFDPVNRRLLEFPICGPNLDPSSSDDLFSLDVDAAKPAWSRLATGDFPDVCMPNLVFDSHRDRVLMLGGYVLIDPWQRSAEWNRDVYSLDLTSDAPTWELLDTVGIQRGSAIEDTRAVYDSTADRVLFQTYVDEGPDRYDGKDLVGLVQELTFAGGSDGVWRTVDAAGSAPAARSGAAVVFDRVNNQLVVWGGYAGVVPAGQGADPTVYTLSFNGTPTWGVMPVSGEAPRGRVLGSTAYDPAANRMVVVGGCYGGCWSTADSAQRVLSRDIYGLPLVPGAAADPASPSQSGGDPALVRPHSKLHVVGQAPTGAETNPATFDAGFAPCMINGLATGSSDVQACVPSTGSLSAEAPVQDDQPAPSQDCAASGVDDLCESWLAGYDFAGGHEGGGPGVDRPTAQALSPSGARLFTTGASWDDATLSYDFATVAIDTATHAQLWATRLDGRSFLEIPSAIAVSPDGTKVFVTGPSRHGGLDYDYMTVAYDAGTGQQLWRNTYDGPGPSRTGSYDVPTDVKVSPDGSTVFVTGAGEDGTIIQDFADDQSIGTRIGIDFDYETVAYGASDGHEKWRARMEGQTGAFTSRDFATALTLSRDGSRLFVTGASQRGSSPEPATFTYDILTAGYDTRDGGSLWTHRFDGGAWDQPTSIGVTPDGSRLFVAGFSTASNNVDSDYRTIAYNAATGTQAWTAIAGGNATAYDGRGADQAMSVAVSPTGDRVYVTGVFSGEVESGYPQSGDLDYGTVAYATDTGTVLWRKTYSMSSYDIAWSVAASPDGKRVYVTGTSLRAENAGVIGFDVATIAYEAGTGNPAWTARYNRSQAALDFDQGLGVTVSPDSKNVFATAFFGNPQDSTNNGDFGVLGYDA
jgi:WD40 repeat protein